MTPDHDPSLAPALRQLALQFGACILVLSLAWPYFGWQNNPMPWPETALAIAAVALFLATVSRQPWWWRLIHTAFMPLIWLTSQYPIDPIWFLLAFMLLFLIFRGAVMGQVPLYLSNADTVAELSLILAEENKQHFLDLGAGLGNTVLPLARRYPDRQFTGVENAPLTWLLGWIRRLGVPNTDWHCRDLWATPLAPHDVVYAFLSPAPMSRLWEKVIREMQPGSLFISNSFPVPNIPPSMQIDIGNGRTLFIYRL